MKQLGYVDIMGWANRGPWHRENYQSYLNADAKSAISLYYAADFKNFGYNV
jgi:hypothetical protein